MNNVKKLSLKNNTKNHKNKTNPVEISDILQLLETCLNQDNFGNHSTENSSGLIIKTNSTLLGKILGNIFMGNLKNKIKNAVKIRYCYR